MRLETLEDGTQVHVTMTAEEILADMDERSIPYRLNEGYFEYANWMLAVTPGLRDSIAFHKVELAKMVSPDTPYACCHCAGIIRENEQKCLWRNGGWRNYHERCVRHAPPASQGDMDTRKAAVSEDYAEEARLQGFCVICAKRRATRPPKATEPTLCKVCSDAQINYTKQVKQGREKAA